MKVVITGGTGMIGSALAQNLAGPGNEIVLLSRRASNGTRLLRSENVRVAQWDGRTAAGWGHEVEGADAIVNLAGESIAPLPWWLGGRKEKIRASRVNSGKAVVEAVRAAKAKPRAVIQTSGVNYYGARGDDAAVKEDAPQGSDFLASVAADWEAATAPVEALGVRRAIYRTGIVLSRQGGVLPLMSLPYKFLVGGPLGDGRQWLPWIHIADEVAGIRYLIENDAARGAYNFTAPNAVTNNGWSQALAHVLHRPSWLRMPAFILRWVLGEMADEVLLNGRRVVPQRLEEAGFQFQFPIIQMALRDLYP